ncbi:MAG: hypothetical protein M3299_14520 [Thermoproteota archaeon]|nr:hypothetical protein [Thermoproteota archaeon]
MYHSGNDPPEIPPVSEHKDEVRARVIHIRQETYDRLKKRGEFGMHLDDICSEVWEFWKKEHHKGK